MTGGSVTSAYGIAHDAFLVVARDHHVNVTDARVLVAIFEMDGADGAGGICDASLIRHREQVQRSIRALRAAGLIVMARPDGGAWQHGHPVRYTLTLNGRRAAIEALARVWSSEIAEMFA